MSFLRAIATDFAEKRLWPVVALLGAGLLAALAWVAMSGGSTAPTPVASAPPATPVAGAAISTAPANPNQAASETTVGAQYQRQGGAHDPFVPLGSTGASGPAGATGGSSSGTPVSLAKTASASTTSSSGSSSAPPSSPPSSLSVPKTTTPTLTPPASTPSAPSSSAPTSGSPGTASTYQVDIRFGTVPTTTGPSGTDTQGAPALTEHANLARLSPLPDAKSPIVVFMGVRDNGTVATFAIMHEAILRGPGACRPNALKCQLIDLKAGQSEQLDYVTPSLSVIRYQLDIVAIHHSSVAQAAAARFYHRESAAGRALLKTDFPPGVGTLTYSYKTGSLQTTAAAAAAVARSHTTPVVATEDKGSPAYAPPLPHAGPPVVQPGWLGALLHAL